MSLADTNTLENLVAKIAFLGLGRMGVGMASRLLGAGHQVTVWNRTKVKAEDLLAAGARWASTPAEAATNADAAFAMLADDAASRRAWLAEDGALKHLPVGAFVIECSTISYAHVLELAGAAEAKGLRYIDCPVTGLPNAAAAGDLILLVGAEQANLDAARPLLAAICKAIHHFGPVGAGSGYKLMINLMGSVQIAALAEGVALAQKLGLDRDAVVAAIESGAAASPQVVRYCRPMMNRSFSDSPTFTTELRHKDASYGVALARAMGILAPLGEAATAWWDAAKAVAPTADEARLIDVVAKS
jgi:3-hydroxyisobutyrate dehydrogenase